MVSAFDPIEIRGIKLRNRFIRSATNESLAGEKGEVTDRLLNFYKPLAKGGIGLIIPGYSYILPEGQSSFRQSGIYDDFFIDGYRKLVNVIKSDEAKTFLQIVHGGHQSNPELTGLPVWSPSIIKSRITNKYEREMDDEKIQEVINSFIQGALRAKAAGFDGVQLHIAHGFLLSNFISPYTNRRKDKWGGSTQNRCRIIKEIIEGIKSECDLDFPIAIKLNCEDGVSGGMDLSEGVRVAVEISKCGIDLIEVSGGIREAAGFAVRPNITSEDKEAYFSESARLVKQATGKPVALVGGIRSIKIINHLLENNICDLISMSRPFIREPDLLNRFKNKEKNVADCISCNNCFSKEGTHCSQLKND